MTTLINKNKTKQNKNNKKEDQSKRPNKHQCKRLTYILGPALARVLAVVSQTSQWLDVPSGRRRGSWTKTKKKKSSLFFLQCEVTDLETSILCPCVWFCIIIILYPCLWVMMECMHWHGGCRGFFLLARVLEEYSIIQPAHTDSTL